MPGTFIFRPIEASLKSGDSLGSFRSSLDPFCKIKIGNEKHFTHPSKYSGIHPEWDECIVVQEDDQNSCTVSLKDNNKANPNRCIGKFKINLDDVYTQGRVTKWFDVCKRDRVKGQLLMEVTYTQANPHSKLFHQSLNPGAAIDSNIKPFNYYDHKIAENHAILNKSAQEEVQEELGLTFFSSAPNKITHSTNADNPDTVKIDSKNKELVEKHHCHHHHEKPPVPQMIDLDPTTYVTKKDKHDLKKHLGAMPPSRVNKLLDPTLSELHLDKTNPADTGMSNPNTMKLGVNHKGHDPVFNIKDNELASYSFENPCYYHDDDSGEDSYNKEHNLADTGMSNPNLAGPSSEKLHAARAADQDERVLPEKHLEEFEIDKITAVYDTSLGAFSHPRDSSNSMISDPNTITEGINHQPGHVMAGTPECFNPHKYVTSFYREIFEVDRIPRTNDTSLERALDQGTPQVLGMSNPNTITEGINHQPGHLMTGTPECFKPHQHITSYYHEPLEVDKILRTNDTSLERTSDQGGMDNSNKMSEGVTHLSEHVKAETPECFKPHHHLSSDDDELFEVDQIPKVNENQT